MGGTKDFQPGNIRSTMKPLDEHQIARGKALQQLIQRCLRRAAQFVKHGPTLRTNNHHFVRAGFTVTPGIFARTVEIERVVAMLDDGDPQAASGQPGNQLFDENGLA